ncbi:MAG: SDR family NAD(P)-dependent oxidoreductase, partial [Candidatus Kapaibacterium sp.]
MNLNVQGRKALVCGATDGIGRSVAIALAESGASIVAFARSEVKLREFVQVLPGTGHQILVADFDDPGVVQSVLKEYLAAHGTPDIVVNNSGGPPGGALSDASSQSFI